MAKASYCGSEDRGFESHYPPHKNRRYLRISPVFIWFLGMMGVERAKRKQSGGLFSARGRLPWNAGCGHKKPQTSSIFVLQILRVEVPQNALDPDLTQTGKYAKEKLCATLCLHHSLSIQKGGQNLCGKNFMKTTTKNLWPTGPA